MFLQKKMKRDTESIFIVFCCKVRLFSPFTFRQINGGVNFKYNYFIKTERWPSYDITWRPGPELSISVPLPVKQSGKIIVRDSWMRTNTTMSPNSSWGSWIEEAYLPIQPLFSAPARGKSPLQCHSICNLFP